MHGPTCVFWANLTPFSHPASEVSAATLEAAAKRVLLSHMRLGFFDSHAPDFPFANASLDWGPPRRGRARH